MTHIDAFVDEAYGGAGKTLDMAHWTNYLSFDIMPTWCSGHSTTWSATSASATWSTPSTAATCAWAP